MSKKPRLFALILLILSYLNLVLFPLLTRAQIINDQQLSLTVNPFYDFSVPETLSLPVTFMNKDTDTMVYQAFLPDNESNKIKVIDIRNDGGFEVSLYIEDFVSAGGTIPYNDIGIVTLAESNAPDTVDTYSADDPWTNDPPGTDAGTVFAPLDCDWDFTSSFQQACEPFFENFTGAGITSTPQTIISGSFPTGAGRVGIYWVSLGIRMRIPQGTQAGDYSSNFTFTILPEL